jgi:argininosuccinate lyase
LGLKKENVPTDLFRAGLKQDLNKLTARFISSFKEDVRLIDADIYVLEAHNLMLYKQGYLSKSDIVDILTGLTDAKKDPKLKEELSNPDYFNPNYYDIHPVIERYVIDRFTLDVGGKTHLAKSRNDQVMADIRIYVRDQILVISDKLLGLTKTLLELANKHKSTVMCGYTHMQPAQAITYGHYLLSYYDAFNRDLERLSQAYDKTNINPLGASALAGTTMDIDREYTAELLGFDNVLENTIDAVSNRDFMLEVGSCIAIIMSSLSRMAEDYILWSTPQYGLIELDDQFADTSTAMPQKKNASLFEMVRGKSGTSIGTLMQLFSTMKGLPTGYNQDLQELKSSVWKLIDIAKSSIDMSTPMIKTATVNKDKMLKNASKNYVTAIDLAEYLTQQSNISFREAHFLVGHIIRDLISKGIELSSLTAVDVNQISKSVISKDIYVKDKELKNVLDPVRSVQQRKGIGNPSPKEVAKMIEKRKVSFSTIKHSFVTKKTKTDNAKKNHCKIIDRILPS